MLTRALLAAAALLIVSAAPAAAATLTVTQTADTSGGTCTPSSCSLRQAVAAAADGDTVTLPASTTPYALTQGQLVLSKGVTIAGAGAATTTIAAQDAHRVLEITGTDAPTTVQDLTITGGATTANAGGAIYDADGGALNLDRVTISGNSVTPAAPGSEQGGGAIASAVPLTITDSTISSNTATISQSLGHSGGGGVLQLAGDLIVTRSTLGADTATVAPASGATVDDNGGGAIRNDGADLDVSSSSLLHNQANVNVAVTAQPRDGGGAIYEAGGMLVLRDSLVTDNVARTAGGGGSGGGGVLDGGQAGRYLDSAVAGNLADATATALAGNGDGGVRIDGDPDGAVLANVTLEQNFAVGEGGAIDAAGGGSVQMTDTGVYENAAATTSGVGGSESECAEPVVDRGYNVGGDPGTDSSRLDTRSSAVVAGLVNPQGASTNVVFDFGLNKQPLAHTSAPQTVAPSYASTVVRQKLTGLQPGHIYHYAVVATNSAGAITATEGTFQTLAPRGDPRRLTAVLDRAALPRQPATLVVGGHLTLPVGVTHRLGCRGTVGVTARVAGHTIADARATIRGTCSYVARVRLMSAVPKGARVTVTARFTGNSALRPRSAPRLRVRP